jgi:hypothetical protein
MGKKRPPINENDRRGFKLTEAFRIMGLSERLAAPLR